MRLLSDLALLPLLLIVVVARHAYALRRPFFADDYFFIEGVAGRGIAAVLSAPDPLGNFFRPVSRQLYFWLVAGNFGASPGLFHALNLAMFVAMLALFFVLARGLVGRGAAWIAVTLLAFHYAGDVPVLWVSGIQDLLAISAALGALLLQRSGRAWPAAALLLVGLLCKENIAPLAAITFMLEAIEHRSVAEGLRRTRTLIGATVLWLAAWLLVARARPGTSEALALSPTDIPAALIHLLQVALGIELREGTLFGPGAWQALLWAALGVFIVWLATRVPRGAARTPQRRAKASAPPAQALSALAAAPAPPVAGGRGVIEGVLWALLATLPVCVVLPMWSAYYFLFPLLGLALAAGAAIERLPARPRLALLAVLIAMPAAARHLDEFSTTRGAWVWRSHINRHYLERSMDFVNGSLAALRVMFPTLPPRAVMFFSKVPVASGWQAGNGPLLRWAYGDTSLRSYYLSDFTAARALRGPMSFLAFEGDSLVDQTLQPMLMPSLAISLILSERPQAASEALTLGLARTNSPNALRYWRAWTLWAVGDSAGAREDLQAIAPPGAALAVDAPAAARAALARGDTLEAIRQWNRASDAMPFDPEPHAQLALFYSRVAQGARPAIIEAYAHRVLQPQDPDAWRMWAKLLVREERSEGALLALERYMALGGARAARDQEAVDVLRDLERTVRGDLAAKGLHETAR